MENHHVFAGTSHESHASHIAKDAAEPPPSRSPFESPPGAMAWWGRWSCVKGWLERNVENLL